MIHSRTMKSLSTNRQGTAVVELAILAPFLVFTTLGMIEVARGLNVRQALGDAARIACRKAILPNANYDTVKQAAKDVLSDYGVNSNDVTVVIQVNGTTVANLNTVNQTDQVAVQVSVQASKVNWVGSIFIPSTHYISQKIVMMRQA